MSVAVFRALGDETRLKIVRFIGTGERCACKLVPATGRAQPTVSQHLKILTAAGVLESRRAGKNIYYKVKDRRILKMMELME